MENQTLQKLNPQQLKEYIDAQVYLNRSVDSVKSELLASGISEQQFITAMDSANIQPDPAVVNNLSGEAKMKKGALWFVGGLAVTVITYSMASGTGGTYFLAYGPIIYGGITFISGLIQSAGSAEKRTD